ncbi:hypothetical protein OIDMADRAFT_30434 [Oidiodendron maius Zn]|uniref:Uncharacterized protein n=1 Tax=Oidiodendron maius (strain Zn) TaxID=913774 RepID=A0A0C3H9Z9_OIDMZ|nr:hypothetical protein OIDMADRAFT_30434 [Oidiodendron maius Zn]
MSKCMKEATPEPPSLPALPPPETPRTTREFRIKWQNLEPKLQNQFSSPTQRQFDSIGRGLQCLLDLSDITRAERDLLYSRIAEVVRKKPTSRHRVQKGGELAAEYAQELIRAKDQKDKEKWAKKVARVRKRAESKRKKELYESGVLRKKSLKLVDISDIGASNLTVPIPDPEKASNQEGIQDPQDPKSTILKGFEAGDPQSWLEEGNIELGEEPILPSKR